MQIAANVLPQEPDDTIVKVFRSRLAWLREQVGWFIGIVGCLLLMLVFIPLVPLFEAYDEIRQLYEDG